MLSMFYDAISEVGAQGRIKLRSVFAIQAGNVDVSTSVLAKESNF